MATAKPPLSKPPRRLWRKLVLFVAIVAAGLLAWFWTPLHSRALTATSYGAHLACSCRFIAGRGLEQCRKDFEPGMGLVSLSEDSQAKSVTARYLILSSQTATYHAGRGCILEKWDD